MSIVVLPCVRIIHCEICHRQHHHGADAGEDWEEVSARRHQSTSFALQDDQNIIGRLGLGFEDGRPFQSILVDDQL